MKRILLLLLLLGITTNISYCCTSTYASIVAINTAVVVSNQSRLQRQKDFEACIKYNGGDACYKKFDKIKKEVKVNEQ